MHHAAKTSEIFYSQNKWLAIVRLNLISLAIICLRAIFFSSPGQMTLLHLSSQETNGILCLTVFKRATFINYVCFSHIQNTGYRIILSFFMDVLKHWAIMRLHIEHAVIRTSITYIKHNESFNLKHNFTFSVKEMRSFGTSLNEKEAGSVHNITSSFNLQDTLLYLFNAQTIVIVVHYLQMYDHEYANLFYSKE